MSKTLINMGLIEKEDKFDPNESQKADLIKNMTGSPEPIFSNSSLLGIRAMKTVSDLLDAHHPVTASMSIREKILKWVKYDYSANESEKSEEQVPVNGSGCANAVFLLIFLIIVTILW
jgi:hypothetical protein